MPDILTDSDFTTAAVASGYRYSAPFSQYGIKDLYVVEQDFVINRENFSPLDIGTPHPTLPDFYLAVETPMQTTSAEWIVKWTRRYSKVPASFSRPGGTYPYTFPVMLSGDLSTSRLTAKQLTVNARIQVDFFPTTDPDSITIIEPQRYVLATNPTIDATSPYGTPAVADAGIGLSGTSPNFTTYSTWVSAGTEIVPEASKVTPNWMGNIHMRETIYLKAK